MDKIKYIPLILFTILIGKVVIMGGSLTDALIIAVAGAISAFYEFKIQNKQHEELKLILDKQNETILALAKELDNLRTGLSAVKVAQGMRNTNGRGL